MGTALLFVTNSPQLQFLLPGASLGAIADSCDRYTPHAELSILALVLYAILLVIHLCRLYMHRLYAFSLLLVTTCVFEVIGTYRYFLLNVLAPMALRFVLQAA